MATAQQQIAEPASGGKGIVLGLVAVFLTYFVHAYFIQILLPAMPEIAADLNGCTCIPGASQSRIWDRPLQCSW